MPSSLGYNAVMGYRRLSELRSALEKVKLFLSKEGSPEALDLLREVEGFLIVPRLHWHEARTGAFEATATSARRTTLRLWVWEDESGSWNWDIHDGIPMLRSGEEPTLNAALYSAENAAYALGIA